MIQLVERSVDLPADLRIQLRNKLTTARERFQYGSEYTPILSFEECYEAYAVASLKSHGRRMSDYERALKLLPKDDPRRKNLKEEFQAYSRELTNFDSLKVGTTFVGYRSDFDWTSR